MSRIDRLPSMKFRSSISAIMMDASDWYLSFWNSSRSRRMLIIPPILAVRTGTSPASRIFVFRRGRFFGLDVETPATRGVEVVDPLEIGRPDRVETGQPAPEETLQTRVLPDEEPDGGQGLLSPGGIPG